MTLLVENFRLFCCIANSLEDGCLPRIAAADDEDTKTPGSPFDILCSLLPFDVLHWLEFSIGKRHFSMGRTPEMVEVMKNQLRKQYCLVAHHLKE